MWFEEIFEEYYSENEESGKRPPSLLYLFK